MKPATPDLGLTVALNDALDGEVDPSARALMEKQVRMLDLQMAALKSDARQGGVKHLREWLHALFELALAGLILAGVIGVIVMVWRASRADGVVIQPIATPPDLVAQGLDGTVMANRLLDNLGQMEAQTRSVRAGGALRGAHSEDVKVQIPNTGVSIGEAQRLLREWLGHETTVTGEVYRVGALMHVTVRVGDKPGVTFTGPEASLDGLTLKAAEAVLAEIEPYRYAVYLAGKGRRDEALRAAKGLAVKGSAEDRAWGYAMWGRLLASAGDFQGAVEKARQSLVLDDSVAATHDNLAAAHRFLGHDDAALAASRDAAAAMRAHPRELDTVSGPIRLATLEGRIAEAQGDAAGAAAAYTRAVKDSGVEAAAQAAASLPRALAAAHDLDAARAALSPLAAIQAEDALAEAALAPADVALAAGDWNGALAALSGAQAMSERFGPAGEVFRLTQLRPRRALALAYAGRLNEAREAADGLPDDCYACVRARAVVAGLSGDRARSDALFKLAAGLGPASPLGVGEQARLRLGAGDAAGAAALLKDADKRWPLWADGALILGDAFAARGDRKSALRQYERAAELAPRWGLPYLRAGETLGALGRAEEARGRFAEALSRSLTPGEQANLATRLKRPAPAGNRKLPAGANAR